MYRVLIVDDQREVRRVLRHGLQTLGPEITVVEAPSGEEALFVLSGAVFDLLVLDVRLAGISGLEVRQRALQSNPNYKTILITGLTDPSIRQQVETSGAEAYFYKPVQMPDFLAAVQRCMLAGKQPVASPSIPPAVLSIPQAVQPGASPQVTPSVAPTPAAAQPAANELVAPKQPIAKPAPVDAAARPMSLSEHLERLKEQAEAEAVILLDGQGKDAIRIGTAMKFGDTSLLFGALSNTVRAGTSVAQMLGASGEGCLYYFPGRTTLIAAASAGEAHTLLVILSARHSNLERAWRVIHAAALDVPALLAGGLSHPYGEQATRILEHPPLAGKPAGQGEQETLKSPDRSHDVALEASPETGLNPEDVDAFWEAAAQSSPQNIPANPDTISYEQARKLGLAPDRPVNE